MALERLGPRDGFWLEIPAQAVQVFPAPDPNPRGMFYDGQYLYVQGLHNRQTYRLDPNTGAVLATFNVGLGGTGNIDPLNDIPAAVLMNCFVGADENVAGREVCDIIWERTGHIPAANRDYVVMYSDDYGEPDLVADHQVPTGGASHGEVDALDWYGFWKDFDALRDCAFYGTNCVYGVGDTPPHRYMGLWSDGTPVRELQITDVASDW